MGRWEVCGCAPQKQGCDVRERNDSSAPSVRLWQRCLPACQSVEFPVGRTPLTLMGNVESSAHPWPCLLGM